jgi:hypothetical protein
MKSPARDEVGVGNGKLEIGKPQFFAIFSPQIFLVRWLSGRKQRFAKAP